MNMKFRLFLLAAVALVLAGCSSETIEYGNDQLPDLPKGKVLQVTASFDEPVGTRGSLEEYGTTIVKTIGFRWDTTDIIQYSFEQDGTKYSNIANVDSVGVEGKTAFFTVEIPVGIDTESPYTLYGFRSGRWPFKTVGSVLDAGDPTIAILPTDQYDYKSTLADQAIVFSLWGKKVIEPDMENISIPFQHFGSMMTLHLKNVGTTPVTDLHSVALQTNPSTNWILNRQSGEGLATFNMATGNYVTLSESTTLTFFPTDSIIEPDEVQTYYAWFIPKTDYLVGNLRIATIKSPGATMSDATGISEGKVINRTMQTGKNYILFSSISVDTTAVLPLPYLVHFTDSTFAIP
jgi:hypothetical protein